MEDKWKKIKSMGYFKRRVQQNYLKIFNSVISVNDPVEARPETVGIAHHNTSKEIPPEIPTSSTAQPQPDAQILEIPSGRLTSELDSAGWPFEFSGPEIANPESEYGFEDFEDETDDTLQNLRLLSDLRNWAITCNIKQSALKDLLKILNSRLSNVLPKDPRTLLKTPKNVSIDQVAGGLYWHNGFQTCIEETFPDIEEPLTIWININMDGLPIYKSSRDEFWPILFNIHGMPSIQPMIIGIYSGKHKPSDIESFLTPFVDEMEEVCRNGITVTGHKIDVHIRSFICDSPARAFIKGVANFNAQNGCLKCTTVGEYSYVSHCNYFPQTGCTRRTDAGFREKKYGSHHKTDTPLLRLPIDMVEDFPVADSLHHLDLGIMKKFLIGWRDGTIGSYRTKWPSKITAEVSKKLLQIRTPTEIHRSIRGLDCVAHWKGSEFRTFLHYVSIVVLKEVLPADVYEHFLAFFCAVTICSSEEYSQYLDLAHELLMHFIEHYKKIYGEDYITSNVHNLSHLVDEVKKFGVLSSFNAYPFESKLYQIKNLIRTGRCPLAQIARRLSELNQLSNNVRSNSNIKSTPPTLKKEINVNNDSFSTESDSTYYAKVEFEQFSLSNDSVNKWFLTKSNEIVALKHIVKNESIEIEGARLKKIASFFETPIRSTVLHIYQSDCSELPPKRYQIDDIKCKMIPIPLNARGVVVFIHFIHFSNT